MKKYSLSWWKAKAWKVKSRQIRLRYADRNGFCRCVTCGRRLHWKEIQAGHFIAGRGNAVLFDDRNIHPQCYSCNVCRGGEQLEYYYYMRKKYGEDVVQELRSMKGRPVKFTVGQLQDWIEEWTDECVGLEFRLTG